MMNSPKSSIPKADRFIPLKRSHPPPPTQYNCKNNLNENFNSIHINAGQTFFGTNKKKFMDYNWRLDQGKSQPGPGYYPTFSDFTGLQ